MVLKYHINSQFSCGQRKHSGRMFSVLRLTGLGWSSASQPL